MTFGSSARIIEVAPAGAWGVLGISGGVAEEASSGPAYVAASAKSGYILSDYPLVIADVSYSVGDLAIVVFASTIPNYAPNEASDGSNTFTAGTIFFPDAFDMEATFLWCIIGTAKSGANLNLTRSGTSNMAGVAAVLVFSGSFTGNPIDIQVAAMTDPASTTIETISSGALAQASEILVVAHSAYENEPSTTPDGDWTEAIDTEATYSQSLEVQYKIVSSTSSVDNDSTQSISDYAISILGSFKAD